MMTSQKVQAKIVRLERKPGCRTVGAKTILMSRLTIGKVLNFCHAPAKPAGLVISGPYGGAWAACYGERKVQIKPVLDPGLYI